MSTENNNTMIPDQEGNVKSLRELTASVQELRNTIISGSRISHPNKSRAGLQAQDAVSNTIYEEINMGRPEKIIDWEGVEPMSVDDIQMETKRYTQMYEDFWSEIDESTQSEKDAAVQAYNSAFSRFEEIYCILGWRDTVDVDGMFDKPVLTEFRDLLIESIFGIEAYQMSRFGEFLERSRMLFELSRLPRLLIILVRIACRQIDVINACGPGKSIKKRPFNATTVVHVLAVVARTLKGGLITSLPMEKLLHQCYARQKLNQPGAGDVDTYHKQFNLLYDCITALDFTRKFQEIREPLCPLFCIRYKSESVHSFLERVRTHNEATVGINDSPELCLEETTDPMFQPEIFAIPYLQEFGRLKIEWTDCLDEHLKVYANRNCIRIFAHPTFFYNSVDLHKDERDYMEPTYYELSLTYALLFRPTSFRNLRHLERYVDAGKDQQISWNNCVKIYGNHRHRFTRAKEEVHNNFKILDINPAHSPTKDILSESFYRCSLPSSIQVALNIANPSRAVKGISQRRDQYRVTSTSMRQMLELAPNYPEDLKFMILSVMETDFTDMEAFLRFPYFAPRLRRLKTYLNSRQPRTLRELWYDRRDYRAWCIFWASGFFGVSVLSLTLAILLV